MAVPLQVNKLLVNVLDQHTEIHNAYKQEKINLWELEGHIKKVYTYAVLIYMNSPLWRDKDK